MVKINEVEIVEFKFEVRNMGSIDGNKAVYNIGYVEGAVSEVTKYAIVIKTDQGHRGEYVMHWGGTAASMAQTVGLAGNLIGRNPYHREQIYDDFKREMRQHDHMGQGAIDIALWDLAGKSYGASVAQMLGGYRDRIKAYASTYHGDHNGGLDSKEAFADFAEACFDMGYRAFKLHGWKDGDSQIEAANVLNVRKQMGDRMVLMLDPCCELRTFADALLCWPRLRRGKLLLVRRSVPRLRNLGIRAQDFARKAENPAVADRVCPRHRTQGGFHRRRRYGFPAR